MDPETSIQGMRRATIQWVEKTTIAGKTHYRVVFRFANDRSSVPRETTLVADSLYPHPRMGDPIRVHFCLSRVLRIEKG